MGVFAMKKLSPCPFCGIVPSHSNSGAVICGEPSCNVICGAPANGYGAEYDPVAAWNARAQPDELSEQARNLLAVFYKTADLMKSAYSQRDKKMSVWAEDLYAVEAVMSFLETIRDADTRPTRNTDPHGESPSSRSEQSVREAEGANTADSSQLGNIK